MLPVHSRADHTRAACSVATLVLLGRAKRGRGTDTEPLGFTGTWRGPPLGRHTEWGRLGHSWLAAWVWQGGALHRRPAWMLPLAEAPKTALHTRMAAPLQRGLSYFRSVTH